MDDATIATFHQDNHSAFPDEPAENPVMRARLRTESPKDESKRSRLQDEKKATLELQGV
jgi:hypothetical protein